MDRRKLVTALAANTESAPYTAAVMVLVSAEEPMALLLTKRAATLNNHASEVCFAGGKKDHEDADAAATALRETQEELGIDSAHISVIGYLPMVRSKAGLQVQPVVGVLSHHTPLHINHAEVETAFWVPLDCFNKRSLRTYKTKFKGQPVVVPAFVYQTHVVWGLTGRIIANLMGLLGGRAFAWPMFYPGLTTWSRVKGRFWSVWRSKNHRRR